MALNSSFGSWRRKVRETSCQVYEHHQEDMFVGPCTKPVCCVAGTNPNMVLNSSSWLLANVDMKGFYRVNYDLANWERLLAILSSRPQVGSCSELVCCVCPVEVSEHLSFQDIPLINRVQIIDDAFNLARLGLQNTAAC